MKQKKSFLKLRQFWILWVTCCHNMNKSRRERRTNEKGKIVIAQKQQKVEKWLEWDTATRCFYPAIFFASALNLSFVRFISKWFPPNSHQNFFLLSTMKFYQMKQQTSALFSLFVSNDVSSICHVWLRH